MYDYSSVGKITVQASTKGSCEIIRNFQQKMNDLFHGFEFIRAYIDNMLTKEYWTDHIKQLELLLNKRK